MVEDPEAVDAVGGVLELQVRAPRDLERNVVVVGLGGERREATEDVLARDGEREAVGREGISESAGVRFFSDLAGSLRSLSVRSSVLQEMSAPMPRLRDALLTRLRATESMARPSAWM